MGNKSKNNKPKFDKIIAEKVKRKLAHEKFKNKSSLVFINTFGLIGWSMGIPIALSIWLGRTLDKKYPGTLSWTLTMLIIGFILGIINAAYWINKETSKMEKEEELEDELIEKEQKKANKKNETKEAKK
jgi:ATP synthase protein I